MAAASSPLTMIIIIFDGMFYFLEVPYSVNLVLAENPTKKEIEPEKACAIYISAFYLSILTKQGKGYSRDRPPRTLRAIAHPHICVGETCAQRQQQ